jgi:hypothetical protein
MGYLFFSPPNYLKTKYLRENILRYWTFIAPIVAVTPQQAMENALARGVIADSGISS